ncbi:MAG TPA: tetratricopeptide repeat protein, partial [Flavobacteriales bacterium]|nr:tetratricopeptide repeat protein [Flavobacteriales bacterium]
MKRIFHLAVFLIAPFALSAQTDTSQVNPEAQQKYNEGVAAYESKKLDEAISRFTEALALDPKFEKALLNRGNAYYEAKKTDKAIADYNTCGQLNGPSADNAWYMKGTAEMDLGQYEEAVKSFTNAANKKNGEAKYHYNLGVAQFQAGNYDDAIGSFSNAIRLKPDYAFAYNDRASAKKKKGDLDGAIKDYESAIQSNPQLTFAYNNLGSVKRQKGDFTGAIQEYN